MPYQLIPFEPIPAGIRRIVREEINSAALQLSGKGEASRDEAIHEARKSVKKIRGVLRLVKPELGDTFPEENVWFRNVGRRLSAFRDAGAMIEVFDALLEQYRDDLGRRTLGSIRRRLVAHKKRAERQANMPQVLGRIALGLTRRASRIDAWPLASDGFPALAPGFQSTLRTGVKARARARHNPSPENYHEWRKRVKDHWYHVRLFEKYWSSAMESYEKSLKDLETWLGEDHNLVVLQEKVLTEPALYGNEPDIALFLKLIGKYHKDLRAKAMKMGKHIYGERPREFTTRLRRLWEQREAPKT